MTQLKFSLIVYTVIFTASFVDIIYDWEGAGGVSTHILVEAFMGLLALSAFIVLVIGHIRQNRQMKSMVDVLNTTQTKLTQTQQQSGKLLGELSKLIQKQFDSWGLSQSEKEVGLLLLKGLSMEEIASVRQTKEKTVRQQASNLYKKADLSGRHELIAFFFEDLLI